MLARSNEISLSSQGLGFVRETTKVEQCEVELLVDPDERCSFNHLETRSRSRRVSSGEQERIFVMLVYSHDVSPFTRPDRHSEQDLIPSH